MRMPYPPSRRSAGGDRHEGHERAERCLKHQARRSPSAAQRGTLGLMIELGVAGFELILGMTVGFVGGRRGGRWLSVIVALGIVINIGILLRSSQTYTCPAGADCDPVTWANWAWLGLTFVGGWLLAAAMGYALSIRFDHSA
jgi:hypothetical protein